MQYLLTRAMFISALCALAGFAYSQTGSPKECYQKKDVACLENIYKDILEKETPEKLEAIYLHGKLFLDNKQYEEAKDQFSMGMMFGDRERSRKEYEALINSGQVEIESFDCMAIASEKCFLNLIKKNPDEKPVAFYHLGGLLSQSEPKRAAEYVIKSAELGHSTSECLLAFGYAHDRASGPSVMAGFVPELPKDYAKSRLWGEKCGHGPFPGYREKFFEKYKKAKTHSAFIKFGSKYGTYDQGAATPEIAARVGAARCRLAVEKKLKNKKFKQKYFDNNKCMVVSVDGEWVDYFEPEPLPLKAKGVESLIQQQARTYYSKYEASPEPKVFVQGPLGNWSYRAGKALGTIEQLTELALEKCHKSWRYTKYGSECKVININGKWTN